MYYSDPVVYREKNLAKRYWDKLFKEYCITDLSRYKENKVGFSPHMKKRCTIVNYSVLGQKC